MPGTASGTAPGARYVREMFGRIAPRYDLLNHLLSFQTDRWWRWRVARRFRSLLARPEARALDLCCGTGDLALALARQAHSSASIVGADFCHPMLERARAKMGAAGRAARLAEADALYLPFGDGSFDLVAAAFGFRNLADYHAGLSEIFRVLAPGGSVAILEFCEPGAGVFGRLYDVYFRKLLPRIGGVISGDSSAYRYLGSSVREFPSPARLAEWMAQAGFSEVKYARFTGGIACLHSGTRPG